jgi:predicted lipopolysaccharide heptosyltransferase III
MYKIINKKKLIATVILDTLGKVFFAVPRLWIRVQEIQPELIQSILIVRTAYIGDVVMTLPILKGLKERFPQARITFLTSRAAQPILANNPYVAEVIVYDPFWFYKTGLAAWFRFVKTLRRLRFDLVIEARADIRDLALIVFFCKAHYKVSYGIGGGAYLLSHVVPYPGLSHKVDFHLHLSSYLGCSVTDIDGGLYLSAGERHRGEEVLAEKGVIGPFIAVHPGSRLFLKRWPLKRCAVLCDQLIDRYQLPIVFLGAATEVPLVETVQTAMDRSSASLAGLLSLRELAAVLERAKVFICNDSAPMHIAAAMQTSIVAIFGPSKSIETRPYGVSCRVVEKEMVCRDSCDESTCLSANFHACMKEITEAEVMSAVTQLIN